MSAGPGFVSPGRLSLCGLIPQKITIANPLPPVTLQISGAGDNEEDLAAVRRLLCHPLKCLVIPKPFYALLFLNVLDSMQMFLRGVGLFMTSLMWPQYLKV